MKKSFSVIIPAYNEEKLIERTLSSIKNQDYRGDLELIVVDNNSIDNTSKIAKKYADKVLFYGTKQGASAARNYGARTSQGDYIAFLDADSSLSENALTEAINSLSKGFVGGTTRIIPPEDKLKAKIQTFILNKWAKYLAPIYTPYIYTNNENFQKSGGWDENIEFGEEIRFLRELSKFGKIAFNESSFVETSPRRYKKFGFFSITTKGVLGYLGVNMKWEPIRD